MSHHRPTAIHATLGLLAACVGLSGCGSNHTTSGESLTAIRLNPTPAEVTLTQTKDDIDNRVFGITNDQNLMMFWSDMGRVGLFERPSRLTPEPIAY
ncbi:MAG: hypothetical protein HRU70_06680 [Phycisphaeraceae bacterium]|nr:MAG: hypothetical protein HRU70_06680 [Phycisphaeraceae bacterium]